MVVDTMVFAYALLGVRDFRDEAVQVLAEADQIQVPDSLRAELANVVWQWIKYRSIRQETAYAVLQDANALITNVISSEQIWERALQLTIEADHPAYGTLFVAAAELFEEKVVTYDQSLKLKFPGLVVSPKELLAS